MYHHDQRSYKEAASAAAKACRPKMEEIIRRGQANAEAVMHQVQTQVPQDRIAVAKALKVIPPIDTDRFGLMIQKSDPLPLHTNALTQITDKIGFHKKYMDDLLKVKTDGDDPWNHELIAYNMNHLLLHSDGRHLIRAVTENGQPEVRGFLSDKFRRLDSRPLLDAFMGACTKLGAVPVDGYALDTRVRMRAALPYIFEPVENELMMFGVQWGNSDFGNGGHTLSLFNTRIWCTNTAITDEVLRQVHIGKRLDDNIEYSRKTLELDTKANVSAVADIVMNILSPKRIDGYLEHIRIAAEEKIDDKDITRILKAKLTKSEFEGVQDLFKGPDVVNLPPGKSTYRLSNAVSFFAQNEGVNRNRQLDLQRVAGELLGECGEMEVLEV